MPAATADTQFQARIRAVIAHTGADLGEPVYQIAVEFSDPAPQARAFEAENAKAMVGRGSPD